MTFISSAHLGLLVSLWSHVSLLNLLVGLAAVTEFQVLEILLCFATHFERLVLCVDCFLSWYLNRWVTRFHLPRTHAHLATLDIIKIRGAHLNLLVGLRHAVASSGAELPRSLLQIRKIRTTGLRLAHLNRIRTIPEARRRATCRNVLVAVLVGVAVLPPLILLGALWPCC